jgi:hypothetical protein
MPVSSLNSETEQNLALRTCFAASSNGSIEKKKTGSKNGSTNGKHNYFQ